MSREHGSDVGVRVEVGGVELAGWGIRVREVGGRGTAVGAGGFEVVVVAEGGAVLAAGWGGGCGAGGGGRAGEGGVGGTGGSHCCHCGGGP